MPLSLRLRSRPRRERLRQLLQGVAEGEAVAAVGGAGEDQDEPPALPLERLHRLRVAAVEAAADRELQYRHCPQHRQQPELVRGAAVVPLAVGMVLEVQARLPLTGSFTSKAMGRTARERRFTMWPTEGS